MSTIDGDLYVNNRWGPQPPNAHTPSGDQTVEGSDLLVAAGRTPNTVGIGLDLAGVVLDDRGYIAVNDRLETSALWSPVHGPREPTSGYVKLLLPPRQSRGNSLVGLVPALPPLNGN